MRTTIFAASVFALTATACSPHVTGEGNDVDAGTADAEVVVDEDTTPPPDMVCGSQAANIGVTNLGDPPDILVVLDRSGSMNETLTGSMTKWNVMKDALSDTVAGYQQTIKFGLLQFPSDNNCAGTATPSVNIGLNTGAGFDGYFAAPASTPNGGNTPAHIALAGAKAHYLSIPPNPDGRFVLFATDGLPNCLNGVAGMNSKAETVAAITELANMGIKTFVLGFGTVSDPQLLTDAANAGGVPRAGATKFYEATSAAQLESALQAIAGGIVQPSCSFELAAVPPDPDNVTVTVNGTAVPRSPSHANGWDYHPNAQTITFFGNYCTQIQNGASTAVSFTYGCPGPVIN